MERFDSIMRMRWLVRGLNRGLRRRRLSRLIRRLRRQQQQQEGEEGCHRTFRLLDLLLRRLYWLVHLDLDRDQVDQEVNRRFCLLRQLRCRVVGMVDQEEEGSFRFRKDRRPGWAVVVVGL